MTTSYQTHPHLQLRVTGILGWSICNRRDRTIRVCITYRKLVLLIVSYERWPCGTYDRLYYITISHGAHNAADLSGVFVSTNSVRGRILVVDYNRGLVSYSSCYSGLPT